MNILFDYISGVSLLLTDTKIFGFGIGVVFAVACLLVLIIIGLVFAYRLSNELLCISRQRTPEYMFIKKGDREWFALATMLLERAECVIGGSARTIVRGLPGIKLNENGAFDSLGEMPFEGMLAVAAALRKEAGILILVPLFMNPTTRRVVHLISR